MKANYLKRQFWEMHIFESIHRAWFKKENHLIVSGNLISARQEFGRLENKLEIALRDENPNGEGFNTRFDRMKLDNDKRTATFPSGSVIRVAFLAEPGKEKARHPAYIIHDLDTDVVMGGQ